MGVIKNTVIFVCILVASGFSFNKLVNNEIRLDLIYDAIELLKTGKENNLLKIIDTVKINSIYGEQGYKYIFKKSNRVLNHCADFNKRDIEISKPIPIRTEYKLRFCRDKAGNISADSFDMIFSFHNYENIYIIHLIEIFEYRKPNKPNLPPPGLYD